MSEGRYEITIKPDVHFGLFRDKPCLKVTIYDQVSRHYVAFGERTRKRDQDEARALAATLIAEWERTHSTITL